MNQIEQDQIGQLRQAATEYLQRGWDSLPTMGTCTFFGGETTKSRKASEQINACFPYRPYNESYSGLSQRCGALVVVDVQGQDGEESLAKLEESYGALPETVEVKTPRGRHLYFEAGDVQFDGKVRLAYRVTAHGQGRYTVAPPSKTPDGATYEWAEGHAPEQIDLAPLPGWVAGVADHYLPRPRVAEGLAAPPARISEVEEELEKGPRWDSNRVGPFFYDFLPERDFESWIDLYSALEAADEAMERLAAVVERIPLVQKQAGRLREAQQFVEDLYLACKELGDVSDDSRGVRDQ